MTWFRNPTLEKLATMLFFCPNRDINQIIKIIKSKVKLQNRRVTRSRSYTTFIRIHETMSANLQRHMYRTHNFRTLMHIIIIRSNIFFFIIIIVFIIYNEGPYIQYIDSINHNRRNRYGKLDLATIGNRVLANDIYILSNLTIKQI